MINVSPPLSYHPLPTNFIIPISPIPISAFPSPMNPSTKLPSQRLLRDDPAKGLTAIQEPARLRDIISAWKDSSMWGLYFIGLIAYIPATPVQAYLSLTLKRLGFSTFDSNMLSIPSAVLQIILMLALAHSSEYWNERTFHCIFGEFWVMPLLIALLTLPPADVLWGRFAITTMISGCEYFGSFNLWREKCGRCGMFLLADACPRQTHTSTLSSPPGYPKTPSTSRNAPSPPRITMSLFKSAP